MRTMRTKKQRNSFRSPSGSAPLIKLFPLSPVIRELVDLDDTKNAAQRKQNPR